jgi:hypothetical protein
MQIARFFSLLSLCLIYVGFAGLRSASAEEATKVELSDGKLTLTAPSTWKKVPPKNRVIESEFSVKSAKGDTEPGRVTVMGAGGTVEANIERWIGQFSQPDGSNTKDKAKIEKKTIGGQEVHMADISGTYKDAPAGPFAGGKTIERPGYRMLAAIIVTQNTGKYFVKFYGPAKTVAENEKAFKELMESLKAK